MNVKTHIQTALQLSHKAYDDYYFSNYYLWCKTHSAYLVPTRLLVQNKALAAWYHYNWELMVEAPFYQANHLYFEAGIKAPVRYFELFESYTEPLLDYYPKALLSTIKKQYKSTKHL